MELVESPHMRFLDLGRSSISSLGLARIRQSVSNSSLVYFKLYRVRIPGDDHAPFYPLALRQALFRNVKELFPAQAYEDYAAFEYGEDCRFLRNIPDVRLIDSMYRTRDKMMNVEVDPIWPVGDETWRMVVEDAEQEI